MKNEKNAHSFKLQLRDNPNVKNFFENFEASELKSCIISILYIPYTRHYNPLLIRNRSWILTIHKAKGHST